jgi:cytosine/adenosine deaminase-related metal-dependent hydrolase
MEAAGAAAAVGWVERSETHPDDRWVSLRSTHPTNDGFAIGAPADIVVIDALTPEQAVAEIAQPLAAFKNGRQTVEWKLPALLRP